MDVRRSLVLVSVTALVAALIAAPAAAETFLVDDVGICETAPPTPADHTSIQDAIDAAAPGDTIEVCPGTYREFVVVNKANLKLEGAHAGEDARTRDPSSPDALESFVTTPPGPPGNGVSAGFYVTSGGVTIDGFTIGGFTPVPLPLGGFTGVGAGIQTVPAAGGYRILNTHLVDNTMGMYLQSNSSAPTLISKNVFNNNNLDGAAAGNGIYSDAGVASAEISDNDFTSNENAGILLTFAPTGADGVMVTRNLFDANGNSAQLFGAKNVSIIDNRSTSSEFASFVFSGNNSGITVKNNEIVNGATGVRIRTVPGATTTPDLGTKIISNLIQGHVDGIRVHDDGLSTTQPPVISVNRIVGNSNAGVNNEEPSSTLGAEKNWWGCNEGPGTPDCDKALGKVDFDPWLVLKVSSNKTALAQGESATITADLTKDSNGADTSALGFIPDGAPVSWTTDRGTMDPAASTMDDGKATSTLKRGTAQPGQAKPKATVDRETQETTVTFTVFVIPSPSPSPSASAGPSPSTGSTPSPSPTPSTTATPTASPSASASATPTASPTVSPSPSVTPSPSPSPSRSPSPSPSQTPRRCTIIGTEGSDELVGTSGDDVICGLGGNDTIKGGAGDDTIYGDDGNDSILGSGGDDRLFGGAGRDGLRGGGGADELSGDGQDDVLLGNGGADILVCGGGVDVCSGGGGGDVINGSGGNDQLRGGKGSDSLSGGVGGDLLKGGAGGDDLSGGPGKDILNGGPGRDTCSGRGDKKQSC